MQKMTMTLYGRPVFISAGMTEEYEDWSRVRSAPRAMRRAKKGHPQNLKRGFRPSTKVLTLPGNGGLVMHPVMYAELKRKLAEVGPVPLSLIEKDGAVYKSHVSVEAPIVFKLPPDERMGVLLGPMA